MSAINASEGCRIEAGMKVHVVCQHLLDHMQLPAQGALLKAAPFANMQPDSRRSLGIYQLTRYILVSG